MEVCLSIVQIDQCSTGWKSMERTQCFSLTATSLNSMREVDWTSEQISDAMIADPNFSVYFYNRDKLFSARAGDPQIVTEHPETLTDPTQRTYFKVVGKHYYFDPVSKATTQLPNTEATDCNLKNFGLGTGLFDR